MKSFIEIKNIFLGSSSRDVDSIHIVIPGQEFCSQAQEFLSAWSTQGIFLPPNVGSILPYLLIDHYLHSHNIKITLVEPNIPLSLINKDDPDSRYINSFSFPENFFANVKTTFVLCSHFVPVKKLIYYIRDGCKDKNKSITPRITELQHGWLVGKHTSLSSNQKFLNPDDYLVIDNKSEKHLATLDDNVSTIKVGDIIFAAQALHEIRTNFIADTPSDPNSHNLLICFSERDIELGYASKNYILIDEKPVPREVMSYYEYLQSKSQNVNIRLRSKPHQSSSVLGDKNFPQINSQRSLAADLLWSDSVVSAMSTVSISSSFLGIPSFFYNFTLKATHATFVKNYIDKVMHLSLIIDNKNIFLEYLEAFSDWPKKSMPSRKKHCLDYSRSIRNKFYNYVDSVL